MPIVVNPVDWAAPVAVSLRAAMAEEIAMLYRATPLTGGEVDAATVLYTGVAFADGVPAGHIALRRIPGDLELKRMFVATGFRGRGVAQALIAAVENQAVARGATRLLLRTGVNQPAAMRLYEKHGYTPIGAFPPYVDNELLRFYVKAL